MKKALILVSFLIIIAPVVKSQNNTGQTLVYFGKVSDDKWNLMAKLNSGNIYYNTTTSLTNPEWTVLAKYDNSSNILDLDNVAIMKYKENNFLCLSGFSSVSGESRQYSYTNGFELNDKTAFAQFCGGQKFIVTYTSTKDNNFYYSIKTPPNYFEEYSYEDIKSIKPNIIFWIKNPISTKLDFATIFFLMKFAKQDTNPCE